MSEKDILQFAIDNGYDGIEKRDNWNGYEVYMPTYSDNCVHYEGLPYAILVKNDKIRMSTGNEALEILDDYIKKHPDEDE